MIPFKVRHLRRGGYEVKTNSVDDVSDELVFYIDRNFTSISDDGYMFNEFELCSSKLSLKLRKKICSEYSRFYFCEFDEKTKEIHTQIDRNSNLVDVVMQMIQSATAIAAIINYERYPNDKSI